MIKCAWDWLEGRIVDYRSLPVQAELKTAIGSVVIRAVADVKLAKKMLRTLKQDYHHYLAKEPSQ